MGREHLFDGSAGSLGSDPFGLTEVLETTSKAAVVDPTLETGDTLMAAAVAIEVARENLESAHARVLAQLDITGTTDVAVGMRTGSWLAWEADTDVSRCRRRCQAARRLGWFGDFTDAIAANEVRFRHGEVLASVANARNRDGLHAAQSVLIEWAARFHFSQWAAMVRQLATNLDTDGAFDPDEDLSRNRLRLRDNGDGTTEITGTLAHTDSVTVTQGLETIADTLFRRYSNDHDAHPDIAIPTRAQLLAEALAHAVRSALSTDVHSTRPPRIEATIVIEEQPEPAGGGRHGQDDEPAGGTADGSGPPPPIRIRDLGGRTIPAGVAEALLGDADLRALLLDVAGNPLWLGRSARLATSAQRAALAVRDGGCIFPGCDMPPQWCDVHHQPEWTPDGTTDIDRMFLGCRHHHTVTHRRDWACREDPERPQQWIWTTPTGREIHSRRQHDPRLE